MTWSLNTLKLTSHKEDHEKLKALVLDPETQEVDFNIASPMPEALEGMLLRSDEGLRFNRELDKRIGSYSVEDFFKFLRAENAREGRMVSLLLKSLVYENTQAFKENNSTFIDPERYAPETTNKFLENELMLINELEKEISNKFPVDAIIEDVIEYSLNHCSPEVIKGARPDPNDYDMKYEWFFIDRCSLAVEYAVQVMEDVYRSQCEEAYGFRNKLAWCEGNWGAERNEIDKTIINEQPTEDPSIKTTDIGFEKDGREPVKWLDKLEAKAKEIGVRNFSAELSYVNDALRGGEVAVPKQ